MSQALMEAVQANDVEAVRKLIEDDPGLIHYRDEQGGSPVLTAVYYGAHDAARVLISCGVELNVYEAAAVGDVERVEAALDVESDLVNSYSHDGWTPLHLASFFGQLEIASLLLRRGADYRLVSKNGMENEPIHAAAANGQTQLVALLLDHGAEPDSWSRGWTPLHLAAENNNVELVRLLLARGADHSLPRADGHTALGRALHQGNQAVASALRAHDAKA